MPEVKIALGWGHRVYEDRDKKGSKQKARDRETKGERQRERKRKRKRRERSVNGKRRKLMHSLCKTAEARR